MATKDHSFEGGTLLGSGLGGSAQFASREEAVATREGEQPPEDHIRTRARVWFIEKGAARLHRWT